MRPLFLFLILLLTAVWISYARYHYVCLIKQNCEDLAVGSERAKTLELTYQDTALLSAYDEFAFAEKTVEPQVNPNNVAFLDQLAELLNNNPEWRLNIEGLYRRSESNLSANYHENLGLARAAYVRNLLLDRGVQDSISLAYNVTDDESLRQSLKFSLSQVGTNEYANTSFTFHDMTFSGENFAYDDDAFNPGKALKSYADSVKIYLQNHPDKQLTIIGHTDSQGTPAYNLDLGLRRAKEAKAYFEKLGIGNVINAESKGETQPVAPNNTKANQQKNRRVNFQID